MFSGVGIVMAFVAGGAAFIRRGWRIAFVHSLPLFVAYAIWWIIERPPTAWLGIDQGAWSQTLTTAQWAGVGLRGALNAYGYFTGIGTAIGVLLVVGLTIFWMRLDGSELRRRATAPGMMLVGGLLFLSMTGLTRGALGLEQAYTSRYVYVVLAFMLPALAVAADAVITQWPRATIPTILLLLVGIPGNVAQFGTHLPWTAPYFQAQRRLVSAIAHAPEAARVDPGIQPEPLFATNLTVGWLREQLLAGHLPEPSLEVDPGFASNLRIRLGVGQSTGPQPNDCTPLAAPADVAMLQGEVLWFRDRPMSVLLLQDGRPVPASTVVFNPDIGGVLTIQLDLNLRIAPADPRSTLRFGPAADVPLAVCRASKFRVRRPKAADRETGELHRRL